MKELKFALYAIKKNIQSSAELRTSFLMNVVGMALNNIAFIILWVFFIKSVGNIGGWTVADIIGLQGFNALCYGIVFSVGIGIRKLADYTASGSFDRFMLSPKNLLVRISTASFSASGIGDIIFGIICLGIYVSLIQANFFQVFLILFLIPFAVLVFFAVSVMIASVSFLFIDASSISDGLFWFFSTPSMFDGGAFQGAMRFIFTFLIPSLLVGTIPVEIVRDISMGKLLLISILAIFWFVFSIKIFYRAVRKYESTNFMTFGN
ncbi:MAG: ABC-2 family transporter protein [Candidatus Paceibacterota bacterium]|jgi:ABC-2 type transport system permease protein